jgi:Arc/MetJ family transcription regulator
MRTTLDIDAELLEEVVKATGARNKKKAIEIAIKEFLRAKCRGGLSKLIQNYEEFGLLLRSSQTYLKFSKFNPLPLDGGG